MRFSEWLEKRITENEDSELKALKDKEKKILAHMKFTVDPMGRVLGINKKGYADLKKLLDDVRGQIATHEAKSKGADGIPNWIKNRKAV